MIQAFIPGMFSRRGGGEERPFMYGTWFSDGDGGGARSDKGDWYGYGFGYGDADESGNGHSKSLLWHPHLIVLEVVEP